MVLFELHIALKTLTLKTQLFKFYQQLQRRTWTFPYPRHKL